jgi:O-antigen ligase
MSKFKPTPGTTAFRPPRDPIPAVSNPTAAIQTLNPPSTAGVSDETAGKESGGAQFRTAVLNSTRKIALAFTLGFIFFRFSFLHEYIAAKYWVDTHVLLVFGALAALTCLASGHFFSGFAFKSVGMWFGFYCCMGAATLFSTYHTGSLNDFIPYTRTTLPLLFLIPGVAFTAKDIQKVLTTIGIAGATVVLLGIVSEDFRAGRLQLDSVNGTIQNANDFATHIILCLPAIAYTTMRKGRGIGLKILGLAIIALGFYELLGTGSRGGFIAILVTGFYIFYKGSSKVKLALIAGVPVLLAVVLPLAPSSAVQRMASVFLSSDESEEAAESRSARTELLKASLSITFSHPVLGVGPGEFQDYQGGLAAAAGEHGMWHETHNGYTQISSECGIPAFAFYVAGMILTYRSLKRAIVANDPAVSPMARTLAVMFVGYSVCLFFLSQGYSFVLLVLCAMSVCIERYLREQQPSDAPAVTAPSPVLALSSTAKSLLRPRLTR